MLNRFNILIVLSLNAWLALAAPQQAPAKEVTEIPSDIIICTEADANINECIRNSFTQMLPKAKVGIPELNLPPLDPFVVDKANYQFSTNSLQGKVGVRNIKIVGLSDTTFESIDFKKDGDKITYRMKTKTPKIVIDGKYKAEIKINDAKMNSKGDFNITMTDVDAIIMTESELYERDGKKYARALSFNIDPTLGDMHFYATGLVPDPTLNDAVLDFINQNWRTMYKTIIAESRSTWEPEFIKITNEFFSHIPFDLILPKN